MEQHDPFGFIGLTYDDVLLLPGHTDVIPSEADTSSRLTRDFLKFSRTLNAFEAGAYLKVDGVARRPALGFAVTFRVSSRVSPPARVIFSISATIFFGSPCRTICSRSDLDSMTRVRGRPHEEPSARDAHVPDAGERTSRSVRPPHRRYRMPGATALPLPQVFHL